MKRLLAVLFALVLHVSLFANDRGNEALQKLSATVTEMGRYRVEFSMTMVSEGQIIDGEYIVDDERYMLSVASTKVYGNSSFRYTIDAANKEVIKERIESNVPMIIANPARAFVGLVDYFDVTIASEVAGAVELKLLPKQSDGLFESSSLLLDTESYLPKSISYVANGEEVKIEIKSFVPSDEKLPQLEKIDYPTQYDVVDLR